MIYPKKFKDIPEFKKETLEGEITPIEDVLNKEIVIYDFTINDSFTFDSKFAVIQASFGDEISDKKFTFSCSGGLVLRCLDTAKKNSRLPFITTITTKQGKSGNSYYIFE